MDNSATKIFLNTNGWLDDISKELKVFLDYVAGKKTEDSFIKKLDDVVKDAKQNREWRHEYMTLLMRDQENVEKGMKKGIQKGKIYGAISMCRDLDLPEEIILKKIQDKFQLTAEEAKKYLQEV